MGDFLEGLNTAMEAVNSVLWHDFVLYVIIAVGVIFLIWSKFSPWLSLTHGIQIIRGKYDHASDPGAITHFQALSAALSATVGLGNIGGVAIAVSLGGPGAVFWMWIVGLIGMSIKTVEVTQSMIYRRTNEKDDPHGGPMYVIADGLKEMNPKMARLGRWIGFIFCITLFISATTGGNMFQAWNVGKVTHQNFAVPELISGIILAVICGLVIIGGIKRIGAVAGKLVPFMCGMYLIASLYVIIVHLDQIPGLFRLIVVSAFDSAEAQGAFLGGTFGYAFLWGMKRALFSNEAGQGSAPIAHSAAMTDEPVREGIVAGIEPFIDTIVVCTLTALVILSSGAWNRTPQAKFIDPPSIVEVQENVWTIESGPVSATSEVIGGSSVFVVLQTGTTNKQTNSDLVRLHGTVVERDGQLYVSWDQYSTLTPPKFAQDGLFINYAGAALTSHAFDRVNPGLGRWMVTIAAWLFAISTMISWSYYGEQGIVFMFGKRWVTTYKVFYCFLIIIATSGFISTDRELDNLTGIGTGVMLFANIPIMLIFSRQAINAYHEYRRKLKAGLFATDVVK